MRRCHGRQAIFSPKLWLLFPKIIIYPIWVKINFFLFLFLSAFTANAAIVLPTGLTAVDREETLKILGLGTAGKILTDPFPLGGYPGFEFGASAEFINVEDISTLGSTLANPQGTITYPSFSFGKGIYNNIDTFFHFTPYSEATGLSKYGGHLRWGFYQSSYLPTCLSLVLHASATNVLQSIFANTYGYDIIAGFTLTYFSLYFGGGQSDANGRFLAITDSLEEEYASVSSVHTVMGMTFDMDIFFMGFQIDRFSDNIYSLKIGIKN